MPDFVRLEDVTKKYPSGTGTIAAVDHITMAVADGEFVLLLGPSGSGKTTLLNIVSALVKPTSGKVFIGDTEITILFGLFAAAPSLRYLNRMDVARVVSGERFG
jgi:ABC-type sugar transport system ATPase subunit